MSVSPVIFQISSSDGYDSAIVCTGTQHVRVDIEPSCFGGGLYCENMRTCDGSCKPSDVRSRIVSEIRKLRHQKLLDGVDVLVTSVSITDDAQVVLDQSTIIARSIYTWYCKRSGRGETFQLEDGRFLVLKESFDWWACAQTNLYKTIEVKVLPADSWYECQHLTSPERVAQVAEALAGHKTKRR